MKNIPLLVTITALLLIDIYHAADARKVITDIHTPQNSSLFHKETDPESGVVSYVLNDNLVAPNQQSVYFVNKSMTEDGRFLLFWTSEDETRTKALNRAYAVIDFARDTIYTLDFPRNQYFNFYSIDPKTDRLYYVIEDGVFYRDLKKNPHKGIKVCNIPQGLKDEGVVDYFFTHLTMTDDATKIFVDNRLPNQDKWLQGAIDIKNKKWERWTTTDFHINHGQINPKRDTIALCAQELGWTSVNGEFHTIQYENGIYPRLQLVTKSGIREMVPPMDGFAMHECWDVQGDGFYWCGRGGVFYCDLDTREQVKVSPKGVHAMMSIDKNLVVSDVTIGKDYRGHPWKVYLYDRTQEEGIWVCSYMPGIASPEKQSKLHPDPHPQFVCGDKYIVWTKMRSDHRMDLAITPVAEAKALLDASVEER